jgi:hypothetical protein
MRKEEAPGRVIKGNSENISRIADYMALLSVARELAEAGTSAFVAKRAEAGIPAFVAKRATLVDDAGRVLKCAKARRIWGKAAETSLTPSNSTTAPLNRGRRNESSSAAKHQEGST